MQQTNKRTVFLDRDGTIIVDKKYMHKIEDLEFIPGAIEAVKKLNQAGYLVVVITSQSGIGQGYFSEDAYHKFNQHFLDKLAKDGAKVASVHYCPHHPTKAKGEYLKDCECRKPKAGMILAAKKLHNLEDLSNCWAIGDKTSDAKMGENAGCKSIIVQTGKGGLDGECQINPAYRAKDLLEAIQFILANDNKN